MAWWTALWIILAIAQVTQGIWVQRGAGAPGGMSDGRFNHSVLEHGWLALRGVYAWSSPGQFFPATDTLALSDTHAGTLPVYAAWRAVGCSADRAWQGWFIVLAALNAWAAFRVLAQLEVPAWWRGPAVLAATASPAMVWLVGHHMQMLPLFPAFFAFDQLMRWTRDRAAFRLPLLGGWLAWQFAASPYAAFFAGILGTGLALALAATGALRRSAPAARGSRRAWFGAMIVLAAGGALAGVAATHYLGAAAGVFGKPLGDLPALAPRLSSWFGAPPTHWLWPAALPAGGVDLVEHAWFSGWLPWLLLPLALALGWRQRRHGGAWPFAAAAGALGGVLFFTHWSDQWPGFWVALAERIEPLRGFRAAGRVAALVQPLLVLAAVGALALLARPPRSRPGRTAIGMLVALLVAENFAWRQPAVRFAETDARIAPLVAAWRAAGDRPILAYAPGYTNQPVEFLHLDAWGAALRLQRRTLNGFSGGVPDSHLLFYLNPTPARARELIERTGVPATDVSLVEERGAAAERAIDLVRYAARPTTRLEDFDVAPLAWRMDVAPVRFVVGGQTLYQFTPPAETVFELPDSATVLEVLLAMRDGSWSGEGRSDGAAIVWSLRDAAGRERELHRDELNPRDRPEHRGVLPRTIALPPGSGRRLVLRTSSDPSGDNWWDWPLVGRLRVH